MSISVYDMHCHFINTLPDLMLYIFSIHKHMPNNKHSLLGAIGYNDKTVYFVFKYVSHVWLFL